MRTKYTTGQTLVELVVAIGVVAIIMTALVSAVTASLRHSQATRNRSIGVKLAQEGVEFARKTRDVGGWTSFMTYVTTNSGRWCLDSSGVFSQADLSGTCPVSGGSTFWRLVTFSQSGSLVSVNVMVSWGERDTQSTVFLNTNFADWQ